MFHPVEVMRVGAGNRDRPFGPLPGLRDGDVVAYEFELPARFEPWPGRSRVERVFVLLDVGVSFSNPCWSRVMLGDGSVADVADMGPDSWYVDLITVEQEGDRFTFADLYVDVMIPTDGRHQRMLDLHEFADALESSELSLRDGIDGLRRWQRFLDTYVHADRFPMNEWSDFPPASIRRLAAFPSPIAPPVSVEEFERVLAAERASQGDES